MPLSLRNSFHCFLITVASFAASVDADVCSLVSKVNEYRQSHGIPVLHLDVRLLHVAQENSQQIASHQESFSKLSDVIFSFDVGALTNTLPSMSNSNRSEALALQSKPPPQVSQPPCKSQWYAGIEALIPNWSFLAENVAMGSMNEDAVLDLFKRTLEYNENLLSTEAQIIGIGEYRGYWTFEFAGLSDVDGLQTEYSE
ncbi:hypothetical protein HK100_003749 [Physocladia obscura]|uniref:SCP domain-containing protein n=1 Tax=Physocladia obscura TaxID=109957 RepID=A0AAD5T895_9FUNG|nr:hypothetical protein HK100_003749 [Physocladia obscura]